MATGFKNSGGADLDTLFTSGNSGLTTGFKNSGGTDLGALFAAYVSGAKVSTTGFKNSSGTDFADLFQNIAVPTFALTNPTPGGSGNSTQTDPGTALCTLTPTLAGNLVPADSGATQAFGSPTGGTNASGKYWKWVYVSGDLPTAGTPAQNTWTAVDGSSQVRMSRSTTGIRSGVVAISFADDSGGTGATTAGNWTLTAEVESGA